MPSTQLSANVTGLKEIDRALRKLPAAVADRALANSLEKGAEVIAVEAARNAPFDDNPKRNPTKKHLRDGIITGNKKGKAQVATVDVGIDYTFAGGAVRWGHLAEFGTKIRRHKKTGKSTGKMPATPFMTPAFDTKRREAVDVFRADIWKRIKRALRRQGG